MNRPLRIALWACSVVAAAAAGYRLRGGAADGALGEPRELPFRIDFLRRPGTRDLTVQPVRRSALNDAQLRPEEKRVAGTTEFRGVDACALSLRLDRGFALVVGGDAGRHTTSGRWRIESDLLVLEHDRLDGRLLPSPVTTRHSLRDLGHDPVDDVGR